MNKSIFSACFFLMFALVTTAQEQQLVLKKGIILDSIQVRDSIQDTFALYIPKGFQNSEPSPVIFVMDMDGKGKDAIRKFQTTSENQNYLLAGSNNLNDSLTISQNILVTARLMKTVAAMFTIAKGRMYMAGFENGGKMASITPFFLNEIGGIISIGAPVNSGLFMEFSEFASRKKAKFRLIGVVGREDYHYTTMLSGSKLLDAANIANDLLVHDGGRDNWNPELMEMAVSRLTLDAMRKGAIKKDSILIAAAFNREFEEFRKQKEYKRYAEAETLLNSMIKSYQTLISTDTLVKSRRAIRREKDFKAQRRELKNLMFQEGLIKSDYEYSLLQDLDALNYNNLGWWGYQMRKLRQYDKKPSFREKQMGKRLIGYLNALVEDNIELEMARPKVDEEAVSLLWMIKTITDPSDYSYYLKIISDSAKYEDFGTAIFYLEELLKQGFTDKEALYALENTALLRIMPEFNKLVEKYLNEARYKLNEQ